MTETEAKILEIDPEEIVAKLLASGATKSFEGELYAIYYDTADGSLVSKGAVLRIRKEADEVVLTFKQKLAGTDPALKMLEEQEVKVSDFETMRKIVEALGYVETMSSRKNRTQYDLEGGHVVFDDYLDEQAHIPLFMEIETTNADRLYEIAAMLGYKKADLLNWNAAELMQHYRK